MASRLQYGELVTLADNGGYSSSPSLSQLSSVLLLSACVILRQRWLWETPLLSIPDGEYQSIISMIESCEYELMSNNIGQIIASVCDMPSYALELNGQSVNQSDYPLLTDSCPTSWLSGSVINLPDLSDSGLFGGSNVGGMIGENEVTLTVAQLATHTHIQNPHNHTYVSTVITPTAAGLEPALASLVSNTPSNTGQTVATNQTTGNGEPHNNIQSSLVVRWWIIAS